MTELPPSDSSALRGARVLLGVCGGIAAYKAVEVARLLGKAGAHVQVVMTRSATEFVGPLTFASLTRRRVWTGMFDEQERVTHVALAREADLVLVAPATANMIAKAAIGGSDDLLSAILLTATCPIVVAPAMHTEMWEHPATRANVETLRARGASIVEPEAGELAGGDEGVGRLAEPRAIVAAVAEAFVRGHDLAGARIVVTAGGTQEAIDPVRFIGNRSSGKMGYAIAREAALRGADVHLVSGPTWLEDPPRTHVVRVTTAEQMREAVLALYSEADAVVAAAAVADFRPARPASSKIKKDDGAPALELEPTPDVLAELGRLKQTQVLVGFKAETEDHVARGRKMLAAKNLDLVVANAVGVPDAGFEADTNRAVLIEASGGETEVPLQTKAALARTVCDRLAALLEGR